jgi:outer membrane protein assembly factor BamB
MIHLLFSLLFLTSCLGLKKPELKKDRFTLKWAKNLDPAHAAGNLPIGFSSPLIHEGVLYQGSLDGTMKAYDLASGRKLWEVDEGQPISSAPSIAGEMIVYGSQFGRIFARNLTTGKIVYAIDLKSPIEAAPRFFKDRMFVHLRNHQLIVLDAATGKILWSYKRAVSYTTTLHGVSNPLLYKNHVIVGFADGYVGALSIEDGTIKWEERLTTATKFVDVDITPVLFNKKIYIASFAGDLKVLDPTNGATLRSLGITVGHTPVSYGGKLYVPTLFGELVILDGDGGVIKRIKVSDNPLVSIGRFQKDIVVATSEGELWSIDTVTFSRSGHFNLGSSYSTVFGDFVSDDQYLAVYSSRNRLYVFR